MAKWSFGAAPIAAKVTQVAPAIDAASGMIVIEAELDAAVASELRPSLAAWVQVP